LSHYHALNHHHVIASRDPVWLQESFDVLTGLFELIGRFTNAATTKVMVCIPGRIQEGTEEVCRLQISDCAFSVKKRRCVDCETCGASLAAGSCQSELKAQHNVFCSMVLQRDIVLERPAVVYSAIESLAVGTYLCPCTELHWRGEHEVSSLSWHYLYSHPQDHIVLPSKGTVPFPRCERCGMQTKVGALY
jgi:hypothetical protein